MISDKPLDQIQESDLNALVEDSEREGLRLEYKRDQYQWNDAGTREFLADVSSFANSRGGLLLVGVEEEDGCATEVTGVPGEVDEELQRMNAKLESGIEPRIPSVETRAIPLTAGSHVFAIRVPYSWARPHVVSFKNFSRFFSRNSAGKYQLNVQELRTLFIGSESLSERLKGFRVSRLNEIEIGSTPVPMEQGAKLVLHAVPFSAFDAGASIAMPDLTESNAFRQPIKSAGWSWRHNFDGLVTFTKVSEDGASSYVQLFRTGAVEAVDCRLLREWDGQRYIASVEFEREIIEAIDRYGKLLSLCGVAPPIAWTLTLTGVKDYYMAAGNQRIQPHTIEKEVLLVPEAIQQGSVPSPAEVAKKLVDPVWQAAGWEKSLNFNEEGEWQPK